MIEESKKSYNPLKMWGSWIGFFIGTIPIILWATFGLIIKNYIPANIILSIMKISPIYYWEASWCNQPGCGFISFFSLPIVFFLYGWGIHSLIRKIKSKENE